jgi:hypothetical protein
LIILKYINIQLNLINCLLSKTEFKESSIAG